MDSINSISKGTFLFANGKDIKQLKKRKIKKSVISEECNQPYYPKFQEAWKEIEQKIEKIQSESYERTLKNLLKYINAANTNDSNLQTAVLLTGVNQTDHFKQFNLLSQKISNNCYSIITILKSRDSPNIKTCIETLVAGFVYNKINATEDENIHVKLKKKQLTLAVLEAWYNNNYGTAKTKPKLVIMLADFEQFPPQVVQDLIGILCSYTSRLPLVMIIGIATAFKTLHSVLPFHITNKIAVNVFQSESSSSMLNRILDEVILNHSCSFFLSGKSFKILLDIFLFYDFSLQSFIQGFKAFMLEQYSTKCFNLFYWKNGCFYNGTLEKMAHEECEWFRRHCMTFRQYVEEHEKNPQMQIDLIKNNDFFKNFFTRKITRSFRFFFQFFCCLRMLAALIEDLPRNNLGKQLRELYPVCSETNILKLEEFQECFKLLRFSSKDKFILKLDKVIKIVGGYVNDDNVNPNLRANFTNIYETLQDHREKIANAGMSPIKEKSNPMPSTSKMSTTEINKKGVQGRYEMLQKLKESANNPTKVVIEYEKHLYECIDYIYEVFKMHLCPFNKGPIFHELFVFNECSSVRRNIVGSPRGSLHSALVNPHHYLQCKCCVLKENEQIVSTMPDISIAYKLHLECNKFINLFDWLQSFSMVIDSNDYEDENISSEIQAKFTRSVAELQFLGFIKQAKQKTDHVMRLTW